MGVLSCFCSDWLCQNGGSFADEDIMLKRQQRSATHGGAAASVGANKQRRIVLAARHYLLRHRQPPPCRFDVVAIEGDRIEWIKGAFDAG